MMSKTIIRNYKFTKSCSINPTLGLLYNKNDPNYISYLHYQQTLRIPQFQQNFICRRYSSKHLLREDDDDEQLENQHDPNQILNLNVKSLKIRLFQIACGCICLAVIFGSTYGGILISYGYSKKFKNYPNKKE